MRAGAGARPVAVLCAASKQQAATAPESLAGPVSTVAAEMAQLASHTAIIADLAAQSARSSPPMPIVIPAMATDASALETPPGMTSVPATEMAINRAMRRRAKLNIAKF